MMKSKFIKYFMSVAELTAQLSHATRLKVGCVIVKDNRILSVGYNGMPAGWDNCCEDEHDKTKDDVIHAESNALTKLASSTESSEGAVLFITHSPCIHCAKLIYQAKIKKIIYRYTYRHEEGMKFLNKTDVEVLSYNDLMET